MGSSKALKLAGKREKVEEACKVESDIVNTQVRTTLLSFNPQSNFLSIFRSLHLHQ